MRIWGAINAGARAVFPLLRFDTMAKHVSQL